MRELFDPKRATWLVKASSSICRRCGSSVTKSPTDLAIKPRNHLQSMADAGNEATSKVTTEKAIRRLSERLEVNNKKVEARAVKL